MEIRAHYVAVGAFVLLMVVLAFATVLWLARGELTTQYGRYDIYFAGPVTGLRNGSIVEYNGVPVGKVLDVRIDPANVERIRVNIELAGNANTAVTGLTKLLGNVDRSYSGQDGISDRLTAAIGDFDKVARNLVDTNRQLQGALQDLRPGLRGFSQQTLADVGSLVAEARQFISGLSRLTAGIERDPSRILFGDRREGYRPK